MLISLIRTLILYIVLFVTIRLMGKRQLGEMEPMEFVVSMLIANLAAVPMQETGIPLLAGMIPILIVLSVELLFSVITYRSVKLRRTFCGKPVILIEKGKLMQENLQKTRVNPDELTAYLRLKGIVDIETVQYAILETNGQVSTLLYPKYEPATAKDAGVTASDQPLPVTLISCGTLMRENLRLLGKTEAWVDEALRPYGCTVPQVYLLTCTPGGKLFLAIRQEATS